MFVTLVLSPFCVGRLGQGCCGSLLCTLQAHNLKPVYRPRFLLSDWLCCHLCRPHLGVYMHWRSVNLGQGMPNLCEERGVR